MLAAALFVDDAGVESSLEIPLPSADEEVMYSSDDESSSTMKATEAMEALAIVLALIALTILFEKVKHRAEHHAGRALRPIVSALFGELTVLGFLSTVTYCLEQMGMFAALSAMIVGEEDDEEGGEEEVFELVESIHFAMFFVMVIFMVSVLREVNDGLRAQKEWCQWDRACHDEAYVQDLLRKNHVIDQEFEVITQMQGFRGAYKRVWRFLLPYICFLPFLRDKKTESLQDKMEFCSLRAEFSKERSIEPPFAPAGDVEGGPTKTIGDYFNFGRYLTFAYAKKMAAVVEIDVTTWLIFAGGAVCYCMIFAAVGFSVPVLAWVWVLIGWTFHVLSVNFEKYLLGIRDKFMSPQFFPRPRLRELLWGVLNDADTDGTEKEPLRNAKNDFQYDLPMWCHIDLARLDRRRSRMAKKLLGPTPQNRQHALYLFGHHGPEFHILCIRAMLVFNCIYSAQVTIMFIPALYRDENMHTVAFFVYCVLAFIPSLAFIFNRKRSIAVLIQVGSIGTFVLPQAIAESEREEKTSMAVRVLVILFKLARTAKRFLADPSVFKLDCTKGHFSNVLSSEEIAELGRIFRLYIDDGGDSFMTAEEFRSIISTVGVDMTEKEAHDLISTIVKSAESDNARNTNGDEMGLSKDTFSQWYANQLGDREDKKECAKFLFNLFDDDNSGDITVFEFKQQLDQLTIGITHQEADELIKELDHDGNGVLCENEFVDMIEHFYPLEFDSDCVLGEVLTGLCTLDTSSFRKSMS